jgi:hypothetical protein
MTMREFLIRPFLAVVTEKRTQETFEIVASKPHLLKGSPHPMKGGNKVS